MPRARLEQETVEIARDLIRIESVNTGDPATIGDGEDRAARYVRDRLDEVGIAGEYVLPTPGRGSLVVRIAGRDRSAGALLVHAHLDVVPVDAADWSVPPFAAEIREDGEYGEVLYGRGAVDMKGFAGTLVAVARALARRGVVPRRDLILAFLADEEAGGVWGAKWLVENRPGPVRGRRPRRSARWVGSPCRCPRRATARAARTCSPPRRRARAGRGCGRGAPRDTPPTRVRTPRYCGWPGPSPRWGSTGSRWSAPTPRRPS